MHFNQPSKIRILGSYSCPYNSCNYDSVQHRMQLTKALDPSSHTSREDRAPRHQARISGYDESRKTHIQGCSNSSGNWLHPKLLKELWICIFLLSSYPDLLACIWGNLIQGITTVFNLCLRLIINQFCITGEWDESIHQSSVRSVYSQAPSALRGSFDRRWFLQLGMLLVVFPPQSISFFTSISLLPICKKIRQGEMGVFLV